jgi:hypothetical protein
MKNLNATRSDFFRTKNKKKYKLNAAAVALGKLSAKARNAGKSKKQISKEMSDLAKLSKKAN